MKNFKKMKLIYFSVLLIGALFLISDYVVSNRYYPDISMAVRRQSSSRNHIELMIVTGDEGVVYIALHAQGNRIVFSMSSFYTQIVDGSTLYRFADERTLINEESFMVKMNTVPNSTEQIMLGLGESLAVEVSEKTGIDAIFIHFEHMGEQHSVWYVISPYGLDELPDLRMGHAVWEDFPNEGFDPGSIVAIGIVIVAVFLIWKHRQYRKVK